MTATWTVGSVIRWAADYLAGHGEDRPRLAGELLLAHSLGCDRVGLYLRYDQPLSAEELTAFKALLLRRRAGEPVAYILGAREFWSLEFLVGPGVLVPRPETELLVELGLASLAGVESPRLLDLCTGSGCVPLALLSELPGATAVGVDISEAALAYARQNGQRLGLAERVDWRLGDLWTPVAPAGGFFDLVTANPPYVTPAEYRDLPAHIKQYEPRVALEAADDGLAVIGDILAGSGAHLKPLGWLLMEIGAGQGPAARGLAARAGHFNSIEIKTDLAGRDRVLACRRDDYG